MSGKYVTVIFNPAFPGTDYTVVVSHATNEGQFAVCMPTCILINRNSTASTVGVYSTSSGKSGNIILFWFAYYYGSI